MVLWPHLGPPWLVVLELASMPYLRYLAVEGMSNVVQLHAPADATLSKKALAQHWKCSERLVEKRCAEGMPKGGLDRYGKRRYSLAACEAWLAQEKPEKPTVEQRLADLERQMSELLRRTA